MDKCLTCKNRVLASPDCIKCDGEVNYVPTDEEKKKIEKV